MTSVSSVAPRSIRLRLPVGETRGWVRLLIERLAFAGYGASIIHDGSRPPIDRGIDRLLGIEARIFGSAPCLWDRQDIPPAPLADQKSLLLALGDDVSGSDVSLWLEGEPGLARLPRRLIDGQNPRVELRDAAGHVRAAGYTGIEQPDILRRALNDGLARVVTLILMALDGHDRSPPDPSIPKTEAERSTLAFGAATLISKTRSRLAEARYRAQHWRVAIRPLAGPVDELPVRDYAGFHWLPDDGEHYYADPMLWEEGGRTYLMVEDFAYALGRGVLAFTELDPKGQPLFAPRPIIIRGTHLSYPLMFRHEGAIYMMPENAVGGHVPLYRARQFPEQWDELDALISRVGLHDATLLAHGGHWWLLANEAREGASSWDCLCLYQADSPLGPFVPHPGNPVLVDARMARSAGPILHDGAGGLIRPVQNCAGGYGRGLGFARIERLGTDGFAQTLLGSAPVPATPGISGVHSYSRSSRFEAIDMLTTRRFSGPPR